MHECSLGHTIRDYLSGQDIDETTYECFRQALARLLVEERGYPADRVRAKVELPYEVDGERSSRTMDLVVYDREDRPILVIIFCAGEIGTYERECVSAARLFPGGPVPLALATDSREASLLDSRTGDCLRRGMAAVPFWSDLLALTKDVARTPLTPERRAKETRIFHTYCGFLFGTCCQEGKCRV